ncbi:MAG: hypothetical protein ACXWKG_01180 [Limisphaerales bacterium]
MHKLARALIVILLSALAFSPSARALTMSQLKSVPNLTPDKFAHYFSDFEFKFHAEVQDHDVFLRTKSGDCDDFATVAAEVLAQKGYTPRMVAIRMKGETHVVCYIEETQSYLDYNTRKETSPLVPCSADITVIAHKVAESFGRDWVATYEFTYNEGEKVKRLVNNIIPNKPPAQLAKENLDTAAAGTKTKASKASKAPKAKAN